MSSVACLVVVELKVRLVSLICSLLLVDAVTALICCRSRVDLSKYQSNDCLNNDGSSKDHLNHFLIWTFVAY